MLAMDPGNVLPEVSCQVIVLVVGTCSSKIPAKRLLLIMRTSRGLHLWLRCYMLRLDGVMGNVVK